MDATLERAFLGYDASFRVPLFRLSTLGTELVAAIYKAINPRYPIVSDDMEVLGGRTLAEHVHQILPVGRQC